MKGSNNLVPLTYVIREDKPENFTPRDEDERMLHAVKFRDPKWQEDNKIVFAILKGFLLNTRAWA